MYQLWETREPMGYSKCSECNAQIDLDDEETYRTVQFEDEKNDVCLNCYKKIK